MKLIFHLITSIVCLLLIGCAPQMTRDQVAASFTEKKDPYTGDSSFSGPFFEIYYGNLISTRSDVTCIQGSFSGKGQPLIFLAISADNWYFLKRAYVMDFGEIEVLWKDRDVDRRPTSVGVRECIAFKLSKSLLISGKDSGIPIKIVGDKGSVELVIPSYYIQGYLDALER